MGGSQAVNKGSSSQVSKPVNTPEQVAIYKWMEQNIVPLAEGKDTYLSKLINQRIAQEGQRLQQSQEEQNRSMGNLPGMSAGIMEQMNRNTADMGTQSVLGQQLANKQALQQQALAMIGSIPMAPGTKSKSSSSEWGQAGSGGKVAPKMNATQSTAQQFNPNTATAADMSGQTAVTPNMEEYMRNQLNQQNMSTMNPQYK